MAADMVAIVLFIDLPWVVEARGDPPPAEASAWGWRNCFQDGGVTFNLVGQLASLVCGWYVLFAPLTRSL